ncbi:MAG: hypothetical protein GY696_37160 [Gammaproteobacteria bacterium]|nr:hypothetical protein [Gammaproteobacteria bacterium]
MKNNKSALNHAEFVSKEIANLLCRGCIRQVERAPHVVSPLSVSERADKKRLIFDLSFVNQRLPYYKFRCEDIKTLNYQLRTLNYLQRGCFLSAFDLQSAYHHIDVAEKDQTFLGFAWSFDGEIHYFVFTVLPFGLSTVPYVFTKLVRNLVLYWRKDGIKIVIYFDDALIVGADDLECRRSSVIVQRDSRSAGWLTTDSKCQWEPVQIFRWLGVMIDCIRFVLSIPDDRVRACLELISFVMRPGSSVTARHLASVAGKIMSMSCVIGPIAQLQTRNLYHVILTRRYWDSVVYITEEAMEELRFWSENLIFLNERKLASMPCAELCVFSDASDTGCGAHVSMDGIQHSSHRMWTESELHLYARSSTWRELETVRFCLESFGLLVRHRFLQWKTDNAAVPEIMLKGSMKPHLQPLALKIYALCLQNQIRLQPIWIPRDENVLADALSRISDFDDWGILPSLFLQICAKFGECSCDCFADHNNHKLQKFYSRFFVPGTAGVDAFCQDWSQDFCWLVPPIPLIGKAVFHLLSCRAAGILVVPKWPSAAFWPLLFPAGQRHPVVTEYFEIPAGTSVFVPLELRDSRSLLHRTLYHPLWCSNLTLPTFSVSHKLSVK